MNNQKNTKQIVHFGMGNFHRAHQALYTHRVNSLDEQQWQIVAVSPRSKDVRDRLAKQDFGYSILINDGNKPFVEKINVHKSVLVGKIDSQQIVLEITAIETCIISFTMTEKAYQDDGVSQMPGGWLDLIKQGLSLRLKENKPGLTFLCCDNLPENGVMLAKLVYTFFSDNAELLAWTKANCTFPCTMVDGIVPHTTDELRSKLLAEFDVNDLWPVQTENYGQWVIEDNFANDRPSFEKVGVEFVADAKPFENIKLAMLNGSHSYLAYAGLLAGYTYVHQAINDPLLRKEVQALWSELGAVTTIPQGYDLSSHQNKLLKRFDNKSLNHKLEQIAMDGSEKLRVRLLPGLKRCLEQNLACETLQKAIATWVVFCLKKATANKKLNDPLADRIFKEATTGATNLLAIKEVFGDLFDGREDLQNNILGIVRNF